MAFVRLKGLNRVTKRLADGRSVTYWYAWKGGPRLPGAPGTADFIAAYNAAVAGPRPVRTGDDLKGLARLYMASPEYRDRLAPSTRREWGRWLDRIMADGDGPLDIGGLPVAALNDRRVRADLLAWRDQWADRPRAADYAIQVLSRVLGWGVDRGLLNINVLTGTAQLYQNNRADQIWTDDELTLYAEAAKSPEVACIPRLACLTGLRREDLATLSWSHVGDVAIVRATGKGRGRRTATIPLLAETRDLLKAIRDQQLRRHAELSAAAAKKKRPAPPMPTTVLSNTRGRPWTVSGLEHQVIDTKAAANPPIDKHLHDGRGAFATRLRRAGLTASEIADVLAWDEDRVERLLAIYVDRDSIVQGIAERIARNESGPRSPN